jgi:hypothetical protein
MTEITQKLRKEMFQSMDVFMQIATTGAQNFSTDFRNAVKNKDNKKLVNFKCIDTLVVRGLMTAEFILNKLDLDNNKIDDELWIYYCTKVTEGTSKEKEKVAIEIINSMLALIRGKPKLAEKIIKAAAKSYTNFLELDDVKEKSNICLKFIKQLYKDKSLKFN